MMRDDSPEDSPVRSNLDEVIIAGNHAKTLVRQLMDFSRPADESNRELLQLASFLREDIRLLRAALPTTISIQPDIKMETSAILANASQIGQIIMNICMNAGDAIGENYGVLQIALLEIEVDALLAGAYEVQPGAYMQLTISDSGHGMDKETMEHIFEPFYTTKDVGKGTGLGLSVVHGLVRVHGGFVTVESEQGRGSSFHVYLPKMSEN
jgi:signal transduction histidine kinase